MKFATLVLLFLMNPFAMAESKFEIKLQLPSDEYASLATVLDNLSFSDWAGDVMIAKLSIKAGTKGNVRGTIQFVYTPDSHLKALALKQSSGAEHLVIKGSYDDFTDIEGRRIISVTRGQILTFEIPFSIDYTDVTKNQSYEFMIELEPTEYF